MVFKAHCVSPLTEQLISALCKWKSITVYSAYTTKWEKRDVTLGKKAFGFQTHCLMSTISVWWQEGFWICWQVCWAQDFPTDNWLQNWFFTNTKWSWVPVGKTVVVYSISRVYSFWQEFYHLLSHILQTNCHTLMSEGCLLQTKTRLHVLRSSEQVSWY